MNILWDMRLFSFGYRHRGVGVWCRNVAGSILALKPEIDIYVWADPETLPPELCANKFHHIPYSGGSWKSSIMALPAITLRYGINLVHYWAALGPLAVIGLSPVRLCPAIAVVYDLGPELWDDPYCSFIKKTPYWRMQKSFFPLMDVALTISHATMRDLLAVVPKFRGIIETVYPPFKNESTCASCSPSGHHVVSSGTREPFFITLGGAIHKNCRRVVEAFSIVHSKHPEYRCIILGECASVDLNMATLPPGVSVEPSMGRYRDYIDRCSGLVFCSLHEGLGLPPIEAMQHGCALLCSDIAPLRETCGKAAVFVNPLSVDDIASGMEALISDPQGACRASCRGAEEYRAMSFDTPVRIIKMYERLTRMRIKFDADANRTLKGRIP